MQKYAEGLGFRFGLGFGGNNSLSDYVKWVLSHDVTYVCALLLKNCGILNPQFQGSGREGTLNPEP